MITIQLTEAEAARICYALEAEAQENHRKAYAIQQDGALSVASGRLQISYEKARDEALAVVRRIEEEMA